MSWCACRALPGVDAHAAHMNRRVDTESDTCHFIHCPSRHHPPWSPCKLATRNILSLTCFDGSSCCKILIIFDICDPRV